MPDRKATITLDARLLHEWPIPAVAEDADKDARGRVVVIAGSREIPGAALLAATAALRAGAGKLVIATAQSAAVHTAIAMPEARVIGMPENAGGSFAEAGVRLIEDVVVNADAVLVGPGFVDEPGSMEFMLALMPLLAGKRVVLDALAMNVVMRVKTLPQPMLFTPHAGEMAGLLSRPKDEVQAGRDLAMGAARRWNAIVALKGATTIIAAPDGRQWRHECACPGLGTSGSGDVLAGVIAGLAAREAPLEQAAAWGVVLHAQAGGALERKVGPLGYLARELAGEVPGLMELLRAEGATTARAQLPRAATA